MSFVANIQANIDEFSRNLDRARAQMDAFAYNIGKKVANIGSKMQSIGGAISIGITAPLTAAGVAAFNFAADFEDAMGATDQIFKQASESTKEWANSLPTYYGIAEKEALEYSNMMGSMLQNIGNLTEQEASKQSAKLIELAGDLTAMYGGTTQDAVRALTGALKGNNTMLDNYGMAANDALVKAKALSMGLVEQGKEMSLSAKQAATLALIYEQSGAAQGQAAREAEGASGSMRAFRTEITNLTTELGKVLLPIITPIISKLKDMAASFRDLSPETKKYIVIIGAAVAALGPLLLGLGAILQIAPLVGTAFTLMTGPIGIAVVAITAAAAAIVYYWDDIKKAVLNTIAAIQTGISNFFKKVSGWASALGFDGMSQSLKDLGGEFQTFSNNTKMRANEIGSEIKKTGEETGKTAVATGGLNTSLDDLGETLKNTKKDTRDYKAELVDLFAGFGYYDSQIQSITNKFNGFRDMATKAGASAKEFGRIAREELGEKLNAALSQFDLKETKPKIAFDLSLNIDEQAISNQMSAALEIVNESLSKAKTTFNGLVIELGNSIGSGVSTIAESIGNALATGENVFSAIGNSLIKGLGSLAKSIGEQMIAFGIAGIALKKLMMNPYLAVAAGAALVALGSFASSSVGNQTSNYTGGYASSSSSYQNNNNNDYSAFRGALYNNDRQTVELKLRNGDLVGAYNYANNRNNRLK